MNRTWRALLTLGLITSLATSPPANSQSIGPAQESFMLPPPSGLGQRTPSPIHATSWSVRGITDGRRKVAVPKDATVLFDWGNDLGESLAFVYDGCTVTKSPFIWTNGELVVAAPTYKSPGCGTTRQKAFRAAFTGRFVFPIATNIAPGSTMRVVAGKRRIELVRRAESKLNQTAWATVDSTSLPTLGRIDANLSFGTTTFRGDDGCNSFEGRYLDVGQSIHSLEVTTTAVDRKSVV